MEHRWGQRQAVNRPVHIRTQGGLVGRGYVRDLSVSGAFVATSLPIRLFACVQIVFRGENDGFTTPVASIEGEVVRKETEGFGIEWHRFGADEILRLARPHTAEVDPRGGRNIAAFRIGGRTRVY